MSLAASLMKELVSCRKLFDEHSKAGLDQVTLEKVQIPALKTKLGRIKDLSVDAATDLMEEINGGPWSESARMELVSAGREL